MASLPTCNHEGSCFAKRIEECHGSLREACTLMRDTEFKCGECPFQKPVADETGGKIYPYDPPESRAREDL